MTAPSGMLVLPPVACCGFQAPLRSSPDSETVLAPSMASRAAAEPASIGRPIVWLGGTSPAAVPDGVGVGAGVGEGVGVGAGVGVGVGDGVGVGLGVGDGVGVGAVVGVAVADGVAMTAAWVGVAAPPAPPLFPLPFSAKI